jgi:hypothetical protein
LRRSRTRRVQWFRPFENREGGAAASQHSDKCSSVSQTGRALDCYGFAQSCQASPFTRHLAKILGVNQAAVSKLERRTDMYVSTLQGFVKAMGGELKITARFPEGTVEINQFEAVKKAASEESRKIPQWLRSFENRSGQLAITDSLLE